MATSFTSFPAQSLASWLGNASDDTRAANFEGIYIHPSHLEGSPDSSTTSSVLSYMSEEDDFPAVENLALSSSSFTPEALPSPTPFWSRSNESFSSTGSDYFSYQNSSMSSPSSSACSTPTCSSKATPLSHSSSRPPSSHGATSFDPSIALAAYSSRSWTTKENSGSASATLPQLASFPSPSSSYSRGNPYSRRSSSTSAVQNSGASMMRCVSTPVETQRQLDQRKSALSAVAAQMDEQAVKLVRSRSSVGLVELDSSEGSSRERPYASPMEASPSMGLGLAMTRPFPLPHAPFGAGWGSALPLREEQTIPLVPFPYNLVHRISPTRLARSQSVTNMEDARYAPPSVGRNDAQSAMVLSASVTMTRPRRTTLLSPMTPLFPSPSPTLVERMEDVLESPPRPDRVTRGMSF